MLKRSLCHFSSGVFAFKCLNGSALSSFRFGSRLVIVKLSLTIGCGLFQGLRKCSISFLFLVKGCDAELIELVDMTGLEQVIIEDALLVLEDVDLSMKLMIQKPINSTRHVDRWIHLPPLLLALESLSGAGRFYHPKCLWFGAHCLALE